MDDTTSDVYNALSEIAFEAYKNGKDLSETDFDKAYEWFKSHFFDERNAEDLKEAMEVGNMKFREPPKNEDGYFRKRDARDKDGNLTYISKSGSGMNYNRPVTKSGEPRRYFQFLMEIVANPGITRKEILRKVYGDELKTPDWDYVRELQKDNGLWWDEAIEASKAEGYGKTASESKAYMNTYFAGLHADGFTRVTTKGEIFPTAKGSKFVHEHLDEVDPNYIPEELMNKTFEPILESTNLKENMNDYDTIYVTVADSLIDIDEFGNPTAEDGGEKADKIMFILDSHFQCVYDDVVSDPEAGPEGDEMVSSGIFECTIGELRELLDHYDFIDPENDLIVGTRIRTITDETDGTEHKAIDDRIYDVYSAIYDSDHLEENTKAPLKESFKNIYGFKVDDPERPCHITDSEGNHWEVDLWTSGDTEPYEGFDDAVDGMIDCLNQCTTEEELGTSFEHYAKAFTRFVYDILGEKYIEDFDNRYSYNLY